jgi:hypothetical protein
LAPDCAKHVKKHGLTPVSLADWTPANSNQSEESETTAAGDGGGGRISEIYLERDQEPIQLKNGSDRTKT